MDKTQKMAFIGTAVAMAGWIIKSWLSIYIARRQHTINILLQSRLSQAYQARLRDIFECYPQTASKTKIESGDWNDASKAVAIEGVKYILNYFEFVAIGIRTGDLDEKPLKMSLRGIVAHIIETGDLYIKYLRGETPEKYPKATKAVYEHILWLNDRWKKKNVWEKIKYIFS